MNKKQLIKKYVIRKISVDRREDVVYTKLSQKISGPYYSRSDEFNEEFDSEEEAEKHMLETTSKYYGDLIILPIYTIWGD